MLPARADQLDLEAKALVLTRTKNGRSRRVPLNDAALAVFARRLAAAGEEGSPWLFPNPRRTGPLREVHKTFEGACRDAGLEGLVLHSLRHSFASYRASQGVAIHAISGLLGHTIIATTMRYAHWQDSTLRQASQMVAQRVRAFGG